MALNRLLSFAHSILVDQFSAPDYGSRMEKSYERRSCDAETKNKMKKLGFQMPLHYPRYGKSDYEKMEEWKVDMLLREYGLSFGGSLDEKRDFAMGAFLWPDQY
ncbi:hypothetical protein ACS0TY_016615 [Phlomoides rotata]